MTQYNTTAKVVVDLWGQTSPSYLDFGLNHFNLSIDQSINLLLLNLNNQNGDQAWFVRFCHRRRLRDRSVFISFYLITLRTYMIPRSLVTRVWW